MVLKALEEMHGKFDFLEHFYGTGRSIASATDELSLLTVESVNTRPVTGKQKSTKQARNHNEHSYEMSAATANRKVLVKIC